MTFTHFACLGATSIPGRKVFVVLRCKLFVIVFEARDLHEHRGAVATVAIMLGQVQYEITERNLHVERRVGLKAVLPIDLESEVFNIEFLGLLHVEDPEDRDHLSYSQRHLLTSPILGFNNSVPKAPLQTKPS